MNGHLGLIHSILPATVDLQVKIPEKHPSTRNLGTERVGSGTIVDPDGYILTVHYVTVGASAITVTLSDGEQHPGKLAAEDQELGLIVEEPLAPRFNRGGSQARGRSRRSRPPDRRTAGTSRRGPHRSA